MRNCFASTFISQLCVYGRKFSRNCKIARTTPINKSETKEIMNHYRIISILTSFSKILEKIQFVRLCSFFSKKYNVIYKNQYGFQSNISTPHAMLDVISSYYNTDPDRHSYIVYTISIFRSKKST